jgi:hypothetical protein
VTAPRRRRLPATAKIEPEVALTIEALRDEAPYAGAVRLALKYARAIDDAAELARLADRVELDPEDVSGRRELDRLRAKVAALAVLDAIGPKLLAALVELRGTPRSRQAKVEGSAHDSGSPTPLDRLRERARARANGAPTVDAAAP